MGLVKESHPVLELNLSFVSNKGSPLNLSTNLPSGVFLKSSYSLQNLESVPSLKATLKASLFPNLKKPKAL